MSDCLRPYKTHWPDLGEKTYIDPTATVIGAVTLEKDVSVWPMSVIRGDVNDIYVGVGTNIQDGSVLHAAHDGPFCPGGKKLLIGEGVTIGHKAIIHACTISNYCLVGIGAIILDGAFVEDEVMIGAGSVVTSGKRLPSGYLYMGIPAQVIRKLTTREIEQIHYSAQYYIDLKNQYLNELST